MQKRTFIFICIESFLANYCSINVRSFINTFFGYHSNSYENAISLGGHIVAFAFWTEQSTIITAVIFYIIVLKRGIHSLKETLELLIAFFGTLLTRSTSAYLLIFLFFIFFILFCFCKYHKPFLGLVSCFALVLLLFSFSLVNPIFLSSNIKKIQNYWVSLTSDYSGYGSGYFRGGLNRYVLNSFIASSFLGTGIGTCDSHGFIESMLINLGLAGTICYFVLIIKVACKEMNKESVVFLVLIAGISLASFLFINAFDGAFLLLFFSSSIQKEDFRDRSHLKLAQNRKRRIKAVLFS